MTISAQDFDALHRAMEATGTPLERLRMCELGAQYLQVEGAFRGVAKKYFKRLGVDHTSFDINGLHGSLVVDLTRPLPDEYACAFDIVTNVGTSEHVVAQYACFRNIHRLVRAGGVMLHSVPPPGYWPGHGRFYYALEFFDGLAEANGYEVLHREITKGLSEHIQPLALVVLRKTADRPFMPEEAFAKLPIEVDEENELVGNYIGRPPLPKRLVRNIKRIFRRRARRT